MKLVVTIEAEDADILALAAKIQGIEPTADEPAGEAEGGETESTEEAAAEPDPPKPAKGGKTPAKPAAAKGPTADDLRDAAQTMIAATSKDAFIKLLSKHKVKKISELPETAYAKVLAEVKAATEAASV